MRLVFTSSELIYLACRWQFTSSELVCHVPCCLSAMSSELVRLPSGRSPTASSQPPTLSSFAMRSFAIPGLRQKCFYHIKNTRPRKDGCNITHSLYHLFTRLYYCIPTYALSVTGKTRQGLLRTFSLQLGSDFHCSTTRTGLTPSPVRCAFCQNSYCLRQRFYAL